MIKVCDENNSSLQRRRGAIVAASATMVLCCRMLAKTQRYRHGEGGLLQWVLQWCLQAVIASRMEAKPQAKRDQKKLLGRTTTSLDWATPSLGRQTQPTLTEATAC